MTSQFPVRDSERLGAARLAMEAAAEAISIVARRLDRELSRVVGVILGHSGKVVVTGMGKSGHLSRRLADTLCEAGTPAVFLNPEKATDDDRGNYTPGDPVLMISEGEPVAELLQLAGLLRRFGSPLIGILGHRASPLAAEMDFVLDASVPLESDPANLGTAIRSLAVSAIGDSLSLALMRPRPLTPDDSAGCFPSSRLEANMRLTVAEVMHRSETVARVERQDSIREVVLSMIRHPLGAACVVARNGCLEGLVTERDLSRALQANGDTSRLRAADIMTAAPLMVAPETRLQDALRLLENSRSQISVLPVVDAVDGRCLGLIRLLDICQAALA